MEASLLPVDQDVSYATVADYREELILSLSTARQTALESIRESQRRYKAQYDRFTDKYQYRIGDWVLIRFPSDESGRLRKLSRLWHGPYRVRTCNDTNLTATKVYFPLQEPVHVPQNRAKPCPEDFTPGYYWYGGRRRGPGHPPRWVEDILAGKETQCQNKSTESESDEPLLPDDSLTDTLPSEPGAGMPLAATRLSVTWEKLQQHKNIQTHLGQLSVIRYQHSRNPTP